MKRFIITFTTILLCISFCNAQTRAKVTGTITDCYYGGPVEGIAITANESTTVYTDAEGNYMLNIGNGNYDVIFEKEDYITFELTDYTLTGMMTLDTCIHPDIATPSISPEEIIVEYDPYMGAITVYADLINEGMSGFNYNVEIEYLDENEDWLFIDPMSGYVPGDEMSEIEVTFDPPFSPIYQYREADVHFHCGEEDIVVTLHCVLDVLITPSGIADKAFSIISVSPNPSASIIYIYELSEKYNYTIINTSGVVLKSGIVEPNDNSINIESFPSGTYILKQEDDNHQVSVGKFVKK